MLDWEGGWSGARAGCSLVVPNGAAARLGCFRKLHNLAQKNSFQATLSAAVGPSVCPPPLQLHTGPLPLKPALLQHLPEPLPSCMRPPPLKPSPQAAKSTTRPQLPCRPFHRLSLPWRAAYAPPHPRLLPSTGAHLPVLLKDLDVLGRLVEVLANGLGDGLSQLLEQRAVADDRGWVEARRLALEVLRKRAHKHKARRLLRDRDDRLHARVEVVKHRGLVGHERDCVGRECDRRQERALGRLVGCELGRRQQRQQLLRRRDRAVNHALHKHVVGDAHKRAQHRELPHHALIVLGAFNLFLLDPDHRARAAARLALRELHAGRVLQLRLVAHALLVQLGLLVDLETHRLQHLLHLVHNTLERRPRFLLALDRADLVCGRRDRLQVQQERRLGQEKVVLDGLAHVVEVLLAHALVPAPEAPPGQVMLEELNAADKVKHRLLAHPLREACELRLHAVPDAHHARRGHCEVLGVDLLALHHHQVVRSEAHTAMCTVAVKELDCRVLAILRVECNHVLARLNARDHVGVVRAVVNWVAGRTDQLVVVLGRATLRWGACGAVVAAARALRMCNRGG
eukprot:353590-Chlamydomonas_euryale.AAC.16